jgi:FMN reductase
MSRVRIVGIGGSFSPNSSTLAALRASLDHVRAVGAHVETEMMDIRELALPMYDPSMEPPAAARRLVEACASAHGFVWCSPLYQGTVSGAFKNALDWLELMSKSDPPYLQGKVVGLIGTGAGAHSLQAINTMEFIARALRAWALPFVVPVNRAYAVFDKEGKVIDAKVDEQFQFLAKDLVKSAALLGGVK